MGKARDVSKERHWRSLIGRQAAGGESVRRFCERQGIREAQFHWWRRTIREREEQMHRGSVPPVAGHEPRPSFVPLHLPAALGASLEVVHPSGYVVRVPALFDAGMLRRVLAALDVDDLE